MSESPAAPLQLVAPDPLEMLMYAQGCLSGVVSYGKQTTDALDYQNVVLANETLRMLIKALIEAKR